MRMILRCLLAMLLGTMLISCDDMGPRSTEDECSLNINGSGFVDNDKRLFKSSIGPASYVSDDLIFYIKDSIHRSSLDSNAYIRMLPDTLICTDKELLVVQTDQQTLYFSANGDIYSMSFDGSNLQNHTPDYPATLIKPSLSLDGRYIVAVRVTHGYSFGFLIRLDLQTGEILEQREMTTGSYGVYLPGEDLYYYSQGGSLFVGDGANGASTLLINISAYNANFGMSPDHRYYVLRKSDNNYLQALHVYDRVTEETTVINGVQTFRFSPQSPTLVYSSRVHDLADLRAMNLDTKETTLLFDGIYNWKTFGSIWAISVRGDGQRIYFRGWYT